VNFSVVGSVHASESDTISCMCTQHHRAHADAAYPLGAVLRSGLFPDVILTQGRCRFSSAAVEVLLCANRHLLYAAENPMDNIPAGCDYRQLQSESLGPALNRLTPACQLYASLGICMLCAQHLLAIPNNAACFLRSPPADVLLVLFNTSPKVKCRRRSPGA
jgi:hypothetical protein